jgi:hypothetical protein
MWWLECGAEADQGTAAGGAEDVLRLGTHAVRLDDIASYKLEQISERDGDGLLINAAVFFIAGFVFLIGVIQFGWLERFLIGFVFLLILGMSSVSEVMGLNRINYLRLTVFTHEGRKVCFTSVDHRDVGRLIGFLDEIIRV